MDHPRKFTIVRHDGRVILTSLGCSLASGVATFWILAPSIGGNLGVAAACAASVLFVAVFGFARRRLRRPSAGSEAFKEAVFLGLLAVALLVAVAYFAIPS